MEIRVEQKCPQCGTSVTSSEVDHVLSCSFCGATHFLRTKGGGQRYYLPSATDTGDSGRFMYAPYLRFKGNVFLVTEKGIFYRSMDTTLLSCTSHDLPPSLGTRVRDVSLRRLSEETKGSYLQTTLEPSRIVEKSLAVTDLNVRAGNIIYHQAILGENLGVIYLPLANRKGLVVDAITGKILKGRNMLFRSMSGSEFDPSWQLDFQATLCPECGWGLDGKCDSLVLSCCNCESAWELGEKGLERVPWTIMKGDSSTRLYVPFWRIRARIPALNIHSFADFIKQTNQPMIAKPIWSLREMSFVIPAFKLRAKMFLQTARQVTQAQWRIKSSAGYFVPNRYPITLSSGEALRSVKVALAATAHGRTAIYEMLPSLELKDVETSLVYLPFKNQYHEWLQPDTAVVLPKSIMRFA